jgi:hypothetical protein
MVLSGLLFNKSFIFFHLFEGVSMAVEVLDTVTLLFIIFRGV